MFGPRGHNEIDDPSFTNPVMYQAINSRRSIPDLYSEQLVESKVASQEELDDYVEFYYKFLNEQAKLADSWVPPKVHLNKHWAGCVEPSTSEVTVWDTGKPRRVLEEELWSQIRIKMCLYCTQELLYKHRQDYRVSQ